MSYRTYLEGGGTIHANTLAKRAMAKRAPFVLCSEAFPEWKQGVQFPSSQLYRDWAALGAAGHLPETPRRVAVLPCAPLQIPVAP